mgnify:CR=1 FL=1
MHDHVLEVRHGALSYREVAGHSQDVQAEETACRVNVDLIEFLLALRQKIHVTHVDRVRVKIENREEAVQALCGSLALKCRLLLVVPESSHDFLFISFGKILL